MIQETQERRVVSLRVTLQKIMMMLMMTISKHGTRKLKRGYPKTKTGISRGNWEEKKKKGTRENKETDQREEDGKWG